MRKMWLVVIGFFLYSGTMPAQPKKEVIDKIVAVVGDEIVLKSDISIQKTTLRTQGAPAEMLDECSILNDILFEKLLLNQARVDSIEVTDDQVNSELDKRLSVFIKQIGSEEALEKYYKKSISEIREEFFDVLQGQLLVQRMQQEITKGVNVTPDDVRKYFEAIPADSLPYINAAVEVAHIVKYPEVSKEEKERIKNRLKDFKRQVEEEGKDFATLAVLYSEDPGSAVKGGELGMQPRGSFVPEFDAVGFSLKDGEISKVFETEYGFHIMEMIERRGEQFNARHILLKPKVSSDELNKAKIYLDSLANLIRLDSLKFGEAARLYSDDEATKNQNGNIMNMQTGSADFEMDELDPQLFMVIDTMEVGTISNPAFMTRRDGTQAYRLVYLIKRTKPHRANLIDDYYIIQNAASSKVREEMIEEWVKEKQGGTYVSISEEYQNCKFIYSWLSTSDNALKP